MNRKEFIIKTVTITNKENTFRVETVLENEEIKSIKLYSNITDIYYSRLYSDNIEELREMIDALILAYMDIRKSNSKIFPDLESNNAK